MWLADSKFSFVLFTVTKEELLKHSQSLGTGQGVAVPGEGIVMLFLSSEHYELSAQYLSLEIDSN